MYSSPSRRCRSLISYADHPRRWLTCRALSYSSLAADYLWLAIAKAVGRCPGRLKLFDAAKVRVGGIKQLQSFERRREWRDLTRDKLTIGIGFHMRTLPAPPPLVSMYRFPTICSEAMCPHTAYQIVVETARWRRRLLSSQYWVRLLRKVLGRYQYHPILASIGQYPIPQYRYRSNPMQKCRDAGVAMGKMCDTSAGLEHM